MYAYSVQLPYSYTACGLETRNRNITPLNEVFVPPALIKVFPKFKEIFRDDGLPGLTP